MTWPEKISFILAIEFLALGGLAFGAAALGLGKWPRRRVAALALGGLVGLGLSLASAYTYAKYSGGQASVTTTTAGAPGPTREQIEAARAMSSQQRRAMIESMVQRLAQRLRENPKDLAGWLRLARAHAVMGRKDDALEAYRAAKRHFPGEAVRIELLVGQLTAGK